MAGGRAGSVASSGKERSTGLPDHFPPTSQQAKVELRVFFLVREEYVVQVADGDGVGARLGAVRGLRHYLNELDRPVPERCRLAAGWALDDVLAGRVFELSERVEG
jgi:hypothetical protein